MIENQTRAVAASHLVGSRRGADKFGLIKQLEGKSLSIQIKAGERTIAATRHIICYIGNRVGRIVINVCKPVESPFGPEIGIVERRLKLIVALIVSKNKPDGGTNGRRIADRIVPDRQTNVQQVDAGHRHSRAAALW